MHCGLGPFASPRAGAILSMVLGVSARFQLPYTIFSWPFQQMKGFASGPSSRSVAPSQPLNRYACDSSFVRAPADAASLTAYHPFPCSVYILPLNLFCGWPRVMHALISSPHTFLCPEWWYVMVNQRKRSKKKPDWYWNETYPKCKCHISPSLTFSAPRVARAQKSFSELFRLEKGRLFQIRHENTMENDRKHELNDVFTVAGDVQERL